MMKNTMYNIIKLEVPRTDGLYGVEIEAEGRNLPAQVPAWRV